MTAVHTEKESDGQSTTQKPLVSVIMSAYNAAPYIAQAIESLQQQTYPHFELIIIDDASTDNTVEIVEQIADGRIVLLRNTTNVGPAISRNRGVEVAKGEFLAILDADDLAVATRFEKQVRVFESLPTTDVIWTDTQMITREGEMLCMKYAPPAQTVIDLLRDAPNKVGEGRNFITNSSVMMKRSAVIGAGAYDESLAWGEDGNLWIKMLRNGARFHHLPEALIFFRILTTSLTTRLRRRVRHENELYAGVCISNRSYGTAIRYAMRVPGRGQKAQAILRTLYRVVKHSLLQPAPR